MFARQIPRWFQLVQSCEAVTVALCWLGWRYISDVVSIAAGFGAERCFLHWKVLTSKFVKEYVCPSISLSPSQRVRGAVLVALAMMICLVLPTATTIGLWTTVAFALVVISTKLGRSLMSARLVCSLYAGWLCSASNLWGERCMMVELFKMMSKFMPLCLPGFTSHYRRARGSFSHYWAARVLCWTLLKPTILSCLLLDPLSGLRSKGSCSFHRGKAKKDSVDFCTVAGRDRRKTCHLCCQGQQLRLRGALCSPLCTVIGNFPSWSFPGAPGGRRSACATVGCHSWFTKVATCVRVPLYTTPATQVFEDRLVTLRVSTLFYMHNAHFQLPFYHGE